MMDFESLHIAGLDEAELGGWIEALSLIHI